MSRQIIAIAGNAGAGKDTAALYLAREHGYQIVKLAKPVKEISVILYPPLKPSPHLIEDRDFKVSEIPQLGNKTYREVLQIIGQSLRERITPDIWLNVFMMALPQSGKFVVSDVRYLNEIKALKQIGQVVKIYRHLPNPKIKIIYKTFGVNPFSQAMVKRINPLYSHPSEAELLLCDDSVFSSVVDNRGSLTKLYRQLDRLVSLPFDV